MKPGFVFCANCQGAGSVQGVWCETCNGRGSVQGPFDGALTDREERANVTSLEGLQQERRQLLPEYSRLRALHGPGGKWDNYRKAMLSAVGVRVRIMAEQKQTKLTEAAASDLAHGDEQYLRLIDDGIAQATRYVELETAMTELSERIEDRRAGLYLYSAEARLI